MKHATARTLRDLEPLLSAIRKSHKIKEKRNGVFYKGASAYLHFHEDEKGIFTDVKKNKWVRIKVPDNKKAWKNFSKKLMP